VCGNSSYERQRKSVLLCDKDDEMFEQFNELTGGSVFGCQGLGVGAGGGAVQGFFVGGALCHFFGVGAGVGCSYFGGADQGVLVGGAAYFFGVGAGVAGGGGGG
jgi:hypothetical protein